MPPASGRDRPSFGRWRFVLACALQAGALVVAGYAAAVAHAAVAAENFSDRASLALIGVVVLGTLGAAALAVRHLLTRAPGRSRVAGMMFPLGLVLICGLFVKASVIDASVEMESLVEADGGSDVPASIAIGPGGHDVRFSGEITEGVAARLAALLKTHPEVSRIALTSDGGVADEGQALGDVIAAYRLDTFVPDFCVSACTLAFVRGRERILQEDARLGFHAPYEEGLFGTLYKGDSSEQRDAYLAAGLAPDFVDAALKVDPAGIWFPKIDRLRAAGVVTTSVDRYDLPDSSLDGAATPEGARALLLRNFPLMGVFLKGSSQGLDAIAQWYLAAYQRGRSEGENTDDLKAVVRGAVAVGLARADDTTLLDLARYLRQRLSTADTAGDCVAIASRADLTEAALQASDGGSGDPQAIALLGRALDGRHPMEADVAQTQAHATPPARDMSCADWTRAYTELLSQQGATGAAAMRAIVDAQASRSLVALHVVAQPRD